MVPGGIQFFPALSQLFGRTRATRKIYGLAGKSLQGPSGHEKGRGRQKGRDGKRWNKGRSTWWKNCQEEGTARQAGNALWWRAEWVAAPGGASDGWRDPPVLRMGTVPGGASDGLRSRWCPTWNIVSPAAPRMVTKTRWCLTWSTAYVPSRWLSQGAAGDKPKA